MGELRNGEAENAPPSVHYAVYRMCNIMNNSYR